MFIKFKEACVNFVEYNIYLYIFLPFTVVNAILIILDGNILSAESNAKIATYFFVGDFLFIIELIIELSAYEINGIYLTT